MDKNNENQENFADMLENSFTEDISLKPGQLLETEIVAVSGESIFLQLDGKSEGVLDSAELLNDEGNVTVKTGDKIKAYFISSKHGEMRFTTKISGEKAGDSLLEQAYQGGIPVEGIVEKEIKGGYEVKIGGSRAFCPFSQMGEKRTENPEQYIGKHLSFKIMEYKENGRNILVSNRMIFQEARKSQIEVLKKELKEGMIIKGTVKSLQKFGAFIDINGIQALLPISEISRTRINDISEVLTVGQEVETAILKLDWQNERFSLSMKQLLPDPWDNAASKYKAGSKFTGKIVRLAPFGAFVTLEPGLDGLIHVSDFESESRINHPKEVVKEGQSIEVIINSVDTVKKRISLKPFSKAQESEDFSQYMGENTESDTYNPFSSLLNEKKKGTSKKSEEK